MKRPGGFDGGDPEPYERPTAQRDDEPRPGDTPRVRPPIRLNQWNRRGQQPKTSPPQGDDQQSVDSSAERFTVEGFAAEQVQTAELDTAELRLVDRSQAEVDHLVEQPADDPVREASLALKQASRAVRRRERREQRRFTSHRRMRRRNWSIAAIAVASLALFVAVGVLSPLMAVRNVDIRGASLVNIDDLSDALSRFDGVPLTLVSEDDVHHALTPFPLVERYAIERVPPHTLVVRIVERTAAIAVEDEGTYTMIDAAGVVVGSATEQPEGVPVGSGAVIDVSTPAFEAASHAVRDMPSDIRAGLASVTASSAGDVTFTLTSGTEVIWGEVSEAQKKALVLRAMLATVGPVSLVDVSIPDTPVFRQ